MLNEDGFDRWAEDYDGDTAKSDGEGSYPFAGYQRVLNTIARRVLARGTPRVLDLGFGTGTLTERFYRAGCQVFGQDFSPEMLAIARGKMPGAGLYLGDLAQGLAPELAGREYDCIVATYSLHHLTDGVRSASCGRCGSGCGPAGPSSSGMWPSRAGRRWRPAAWQRGRAGMGRRSIS